MPLPETPAGEEAPDEIMEQGAIWLARRDRGLTRAEQDEYLEWLQADPRHAEAVKRCAAALERMMRLYEWQPAHTADPNPDLFARAPRQRWWRRAAAFTAAAAGLAILAGLAWREREPRPGADERAVKPYLQVNEQVALPDGSRVELKPGCEVVVRYSSIERRVQLQRGEAHFTVWKDHARPFVVEAGAVKVVAVGTSFSVRREPGDLEVLVTSGSIKLEAEKAPGEAEAPVVAAGHRAVIPLAALQAPAELRPVITAISPAEMAQSLAWMAPRLQFHETPLGEVVKQFNRLNRQQLVLGEADLAELRIGGAFRPDNVDAFVRLLEVTFQIRAERGGEHEIVLRRAP